MIRILCIAHVHCWCCIMTSLCVEGVLFYIIVENIAHKAEIKVLKLANGEYTLLKLSNGKQALLKHQLFTTSFLYHSIVFT